MSRTFDAIRTSLMAGAAVLIAAGAAQAQLDTALNVARQSTQAGAQAQSQIDTLADQASDAEREFLAVQEQIQSQEVFLQQQRVFLRSQENELTSLERQLERVETIERDLTPMLLEMYVQLEAFIQADLPFQMGDRMDRLADIEQALGDPLIPPAEKYRLLLNAYEIESSYGRSARLHRGNRCGRRRRAG
jgi:chromosome segregation ATPase